MSDASPVTATAVDAASAGAAPAVGALPSGGVRVPEQRSGPDDEALVTLYRTQFDRMVRVAFAITSSNALAEEIAQDAFVQVYRRWESVQNPTAYLRKAVVNGATSQIRRLIFERRLPDPPLLTTQQTEADDELRQALDALPLRQRAALVLRFYEDLPDDEIAQTLGVREATVRSLVHRGLARLRETVG